jgi:hypothetical protein
MAEKIVWYLFRWAESRNDTSIAQGRGFMMHEPTTRRNKNENLPWRFLPSPGTSEQPSSSVPAQEGLPTRVKWIGILQRCGARRPWAAMATWLRMTGSPFTRVAKLTVGADWQQTLVAEDGGEERFVVGGRVEDGG